MQFSVKVARPEQQRSACAVVAVFDNGELSPAAQSLDQAGEGFIRAVLDAGDLEGKPGQTLPLRPPANAKLGPQRVLLVGAGKAEPMTAAAFAKVVKASTAALHSLRVKDAALYLAELEVTDRDPAWRARVCAQTLVNAGYRFQAMKSSKGDTPALNKAMIAAPDRQALHGCQDGVTLGQATANGMALARDLGNLPGNVCTPSYLATQARALARKHSKLSCKVLDEKQMKELGMGALLSVSAGSDQPAKMIIFEYKGAARQQPTVLVGKGITFDTGGISLKPGQKMDEMKFDMCGAASVFGTVAAAAELGLPIHLVGIVPASENMPSGRATKPGDIVTSMAGTTIEVLNTDAEGRLVLCDALTYAKRYKPAAVVDIATLTGACVVALGSHATGLFANQQPLAEELLTAGEASGDRAWQMPLWDEYQQQLDSPYADLANIGGPEAGSVTAACFLARFAEDYHWAHLDIAGTAWNSGGIKGATGRPVPLLVEFLRQRASQAGGAPAKAKAKTTANTKAAKPKGRKAAKSRS